MTATPAETPTRSRLPRRSEVLIVLLYISLSVAMAVFAYVGPGDHNQRAVMIVLGAQVPLSFVLGAYSRAPLTVAGVVISFEILVYAAERFLPGGVFGDLLSVNVWLQFSLSTLASSVLLFGDRRRRWIPWVLIGVLAVLAMRPWQPTWPMLAGGLLGTAGPWLIGMYMAARQRLVSALRDRASRAERERHLLAEQARADERAKLAAEMHDVVTHRVTLMILQAGALSLTTTEPETKAAADELRDGGREALEELRDLVGVLRTSPLADQSDPFSEPDFDTITERPVITRIPPAAPSLVDIPRLAAESTAIGVPVDLSEEGDRQVISPTMGRTAYRIVQEALTNARKHAYGSEVRVQLEYHLDRLCLTVRNTPPDRTRDQPADLSAVGSGSGLLGLRRRVELVQGQLTSGPSRDGGFEVTAILPAYVPTPD